MNQTDQTDQTEDSVVPFDIICSVSRTALSCLKDWLHPYAFTILLSEVISNICTLILFVAKELALQNPDILTFDELPNDNYPPTEIDSIRRLLLLRSDMKKIRDLFNEFHNPVGEKIFFEKISLINGVSIMLYYIYSLFLSIYSYYPSFKFIILYYIIYIKLDSNCFWRKFYYIIK